MGQPHQVSHRKLFLFLKLKSPLWVASLWVDRPQEKITERAEVILFKDFWHMFIISSMVHVKNLIKKINDLANTLSFMKQFAILS